LYQTVITKLSNNKPFRQIKPFEIQIAHFYFNSKTIHPKQRTLLTAQTAGSVRTPKKDAKQKVANGFGSN